MTRRYAAAFSGHPLAAQAVGEAVGAILDQCDEPPDLLVVFLGDDHVPMAGEITRTLRSLINPRVMVGAASPSLLGGSQDVEHGVALALFAARLDAELTPVRLEGFPGPSGELLIAGGVGIEADATWLLLADSESFPSEAVIEHLNEVAPGLVVTGGTVTARRYGTSGSLLLDDERFHDGAVGVLIPSDVPIEVVMSQGCRPIGEPMVVTRSDGAVLLELAGGPALSRLMELLEGLDPPTRDLAAEHLRVGLALDERLEQFGPGDFVARSVLGADRARLGIAIGAHVEVGTTVQFHVRDPDFAAAHLHQLLAGRSAGGAVMFTDHSRGRGFYGAAGGDVTAVSDVLGAVPLCGLFGGATIGPLHGLNVVCADAASVVILG